MDGLTYLGRPCLETRRRGQMRGLTTLTGLRTDVLPLNCDLFSVYM